ncbi:MAG: carboxypeptidase regulatory-like domain-containing protein [Vicinamibacterales bacterium]
MTRGSYLFCLIAAWLLAAPVSIAAAQKQPDPGSIRLRVKDPSGAVIPGALVQVTGVEPRTSHIVRSDVVSDSEGIATIEGLVPGRYAVEVAFPGFETQTIADLRVRTGETRRDIVLPIMRVDESVAVGRDPETSASDPGNDRFSAVLTREQIDALPDDPEEMEKVLQEMAGPGGTIRVDGFRGGRLPPKSQIRSIRFASGMFAAENHGGGLVFVDIMTQPGMGPMRGGLDVTFRDEAMNARNAFQQEKAAEQTQQYAFNLSGTLVPERTSFSLSAGGASLYDSANVFAALADGTRDTSAVRRPSDRINFTGRLDHALTKSHSLRASYQQNGNDQRNLGVGGFDLADRAYDRTLNERLLRLSESGPLARSWFGESRLQVRWTDSDVVSSVEAATTRVLDAFTTGGAQQAGGRQGTEFEWATNVDWAHGRHAVRIGGMVEGGSYRSESQSNYLGTYTFASLADYVGGRPSIFTQRTGDPLVEYAHWQAGVFVQDDWRARKNLTLSAGLRQEFQAHAGDALNLAPRAGLTWSPFKNGKTTVRAGGGIFYEWLEAEVYEQTLRVDGIRQQDLVVRDPGYPNPFDGAAAEVLPASKYLLASSLVLPTRTMANIGIAHRLTPTMGVNATFTHMRGSNRLRGRNVNAPLEGVRPDPLLGNVTQVESTGRMRGNQAHVGMSFNVPARRLFVFANYVFADQKNDSDGPFSLPADSYDLAAEWGPAAAIPRHTVSAVVNTPLAAGIRLGLTATARSGTRYNITTGRDDNGDTVFNDRPEGVGRNSAVAQGMWDVSARLSYAFGFGEHPAGEGGAGPTMIVQRIGPGGGGDMLGGMMGGGAENKRVRIELFVSAQNLFNNVVYAGYSGVTTSPFFGQPTSAMPGRRVDVGMRVGF